VKQKQGNPKMRIVFMSPPFYSHFQPMLVLAKAFRRAGAEVTIACSKSFSDSIKAAGFDFWEIEINRNANTGIAQKTAQDRSETDRLDGFIEATKSGAMEVLTYQAQHRKADMLSNPVELQQEIARLAEHIQPDLFVVDQLSYGVTLGLHASGLSFITFCPGHPTYIPTGEQRFGVPYAWPAGFQPDQTEIQPLIALADEVDNQFTHLFNQLIQAVSPHRSIVDSAFRLCSPTAILFNYPDFGNLHPEEGGAKKYFLGACFEPQPLDQEWMDLLDRHQEHMKILLSLGTFLSARADVLERLITALQKRFPDAALFVAAGASREALLHYESDSVILSEFLPQTGLLPYMDLVIHHGGNNSFTETLSFGKPAVILPFSSDQFSIAHDAEMWGIARVLNPNDFSAEQLEAAVNWSLRAETREKLLFWQRQIPRNALDLTASSILNDFTSKGGIIFPIASR
jgi:UDP:flavonoid glycosyltransferase YjiC (YdhE family)